jgi:2-phospho-L-lactate guanylyltransferase
VSVSAVVPVKSLVEAKSRLRPFLEARERADLVLRMMEGVLLALKGSGIERTFVVSPDRRVLEAARDLGAVTLLQSGSGLNPALDEGRRRVIEAGSRSLLVLPADLPTVGAADVLALPGAADGAPSMVIAPDLSRSGTNALLLEPPGAVPFLFGTGSFGAHLRAARELGVRARVCEREGLSFDLDTGADLDLLSAAEARR